MTTTSSDAFVFFGASGDLAHKKIYPALQALIRSDRLDMPIIGVAFSGWNLDAFRANIRQSLQQQGALDETAFARLAPLLSYVDGNYENPETFQKLRAALGPASRPLYYLAIPPTMFATVAEGIAGAGEAADARIVVEKPFGRDLASAQALNKTLHKFFPEKAIFRIDHYLGKEPVENLVYFRYANPLVDGCWSNQSLESVQITMAESFGVAGRGKFYEEAGAIRDVVQNHLLQVIACVAMELPGTRSHDAMRTERARLLRAVRTLEKRDVVRGQFEGYRSEPGVAPHSQVETFAALRFQIANERWSGVPFFVRAGKCLPVTATEVVVRFKQSASRALDEHIPPAPNRVRFRLTPEEVIAMGVNVKKPGERTAGAAIELVAHYTPPDEMEPYERLLGDAAAGDPTLFAREDAVEEAWRIVDPILGNAVPLHMYRPGTWGPDAPARAVAPKGGWHDPAPEQPPSG